MGERRPNYNFIILLIYFCCVPIYQSAANRESAENLSMWLILHRPLKINQTLQEKETKSSFIHFLLVLPWFLKAYSSVPAGLQTQKEKMCAGPTAELKAVTLLSAAQFSCLLQGCLTLHQSDVFLLFRAHNLKEELIQNQRCSYSLVSLSPNARNPTASKQTSRWSGQTQQSPELLSPPASYGAGPRPSCPISFSFLVFHHKPSSARGQPCKQCWVELCNTCYLTHPSLPVYTR